MNRKTPKINLKLSNRNLMEDYIRKIIQCTGIQKSKMQQFHHEKQATFSQEVSLNIYAVAVASVPSRTKKAGKLPDTAN